MGDGKGAKIRSEIIDTNTPLEAKRLARKYEKEFGDEEYWRIWNEERKVEVMRKGIRAKFNQNPEMKEKLLATGNKVLIEDSSKDDYWGGAIKGSANMLGYLLMELRHLLRKELKS